MMRTREAGTLWIGGALSWLEQLCLKSFVDQGQRITLFSYAPVANVPEGVICRDGREVIDTEDFIKYERKDSFALFADLFRLHMLERCPGMIWVDTDVYCHRPMRYQSDYVMGFELPGGHRVNNAVLGLPAGSALLSELLEFTSDRFAIAPFLPTDLQLEYQAAAAAGAPVHVSQQPWGVWGPMMLTHFVHKQGLALKVQPLEAFYPVTFPDRLKFLRPERVAKAMLTPRTTALHLWASNKREMGLRHSGEPPAGSYLAMLVARHGIRPAAAPIAGRGKRSFDAGLVDRLGLSRVERFADIGGGAQSLALAAHARWGCAIDLVDLAPDGEFGDTESAWVAPYRAYLRERGVPEDQLRIVRRATDLRPADLAVTLNGFGDVSKIKYLKPVLEAGLHADSRLVLDIRKGSGAYPFLRAYGTCDTLETKADGEVHLSRVVFMPAPQSPVAASDEGDHGWGEIARGLAGPDGFYRNEPGGHSFLYVPRDPGTLVVTFDNLDIAMTKRDERRPWGFDFIARQGWSMLGVMAGGWTWYRDPWVCAEFDRLRNEGFFDRFGRVVFYGASMGGYAAAAFSAASPGADVVTISPQSTLDKTLVPWETRYSTAWGRDFSGPYGDAAQASAQARRVVVFYDPYEPLDAGHVARFTAPNVMRLRANLLGHRLGSSLQQMGILGPLVLSALDGSLSEAEFYTKIRARKYFARYQREIFDKAVARGHHKLAQQMGDWVLRQGDNRHIRVALASMRAQT